MLSCNVNTIHRQADRLRVKTNRRNDRTEWQIARRDDVRLFYNIERQEKKPCVTSKITIKPPLYE